MHSKRKVNIIVKERKRHDKLYQAILYLRNLNMCNTVIPKEYCYWALWRRERKEKKHKQRYLMDNNGNRSLMEPQT